MTEITAIKLQKRNYQRVNIYLNGEFAFGLARIVAAWLQVGQKISQEKIEELESFENKEYSPISELQYINDVEAIVDYVLEHHSIKNKGVLDTLDKAILDEQTQWLNANFSFKDGTKFL